MLVDKNAENDFWYKFDNYYQFKINNTTGQQIGRVMNFSISKPLGTLSSNNLKAFLQSEQAASLADAINNSRPHYVEILRNDFGMNFTDEKIMSSFAWEVFRDFGLGVLYDPHSRYPVSDICTLWMVVNNFTLIGIVSIGSHLKWNQRVHLPPLFIRGRDGST